ncbi:hypothetical protein ACHAPE_006716 [Trichoderma viride]
MNSYAPACTVNTCLQQVAGIVDNNPLAQFSACVSNLAHQTPTGDVVFTTDTTSVLYTDIIVSPTTDVSTVVQTVTVPSKVSQTQTETVYSPTVVKTTTTTPRRLLFGLRLHRGCGHYEIRRAPRRNLDFDCGYDSKRCHLVDVPVVYPYADPTEPYYVGWTRSTNGGVTVDANNFTLVYEGLFRAPATGSYNFCTSADDESDLFFGHDNAVNCLGGTAPASATPFLTTNNASDLGLYICKAVTLTEGLYYPVRNVVGNGIGPSAFGFTVQLPSSSSSTDDFTGYAYPLDCGSFA